MEADELTEPGLLYHLGIDGTFYSFDGTLIVPREIWLKWGNDVTGIPYVEVGG